MVYGLLTDANIELGNYSDAETSAQWMLNLRPGNVPALTRAAHICANSSGIGRGLRVDGVWHISRRRRLKPSSAHGSLTQMGHLRLRVWQSGRARRNFCSRR